MIDLKQDTKANGMSEEKARSIRILVTGEREDLDHRLPSELGFNGLSLEWISLPLLRFERLTVDAEVIENALAIPPEWIIFTSIRTVTFWSELLMETGVDFPLESQVACIGETTAEAANQDGFTPDFYPTEPGSEKFLEEFEHLLSNNSVKPRVLIPISESGRGLIALRLKELGCTVTTLPIYRTIAREDAGRWISQEQIAKSSMIIFTSPSSVDAFLQNFSVPENISVACLGKYTSEYLSKKGLKNRIVPGGDFERVGELL